MTVLITGAAGNLGVKLRRHLEGRYELRLIDLDPHGDASILQADLSQWDARWVEQFRGVDTVVHLAADPVAFRDWPELIASNLDALIFTFQACVAAKVQRLVYASSNHVMGGYKDDVTVTPITPETPPRPGTRYTADGHARDSTPYASCKLFGERLAKCYSDVHGLSVIAVRIGWTLRGENHPQDIPADREPWFRQMWLSNRDFCRLMECCITADPAIRFAIINGMSNNRGMRWDMETTRRVVGFIPEDDIGPT